MRSVNAKRQTIIKFVREDGLDPSISIPRLVVNLYIFLIFSVFRESFQESNNRQIFVGGISLGTQEKKYQIVN